MPDPADGPRVPRSLGYATDLMHRRLAGSQITERDGHLVIRTRENPGYYWGNFLLVTPTGGAAGPAEWVEAFRAEFPEAGHVAIGLDVVCADGLDRAEFAGARLDLDVDRVLTATNLTAPARANREAEYRPLSDDHEWDGARKLHRLTSGLPDTPESSTFLARRAAEDHRLSDTRRARYFGAFVDGRLVSTLGLISDGSGPARYQDVATHPDFRRRGLAGTLVYEAGRYGLEQLGAPRLVIVADPAGPAIGLYRSLGFADTEDQVALLRAPGIRDDPA